MKELNWETLEFALFIFLFIIYLGSIIVQMVLHLNLKNKLKIFEMGGNLTANQMIAKFWLAIWLTPIFNK